MPELNLPLSGAVTQLFKAWALLFTSFANQVGLVNINVAKSSDPQAEVEILSDVASYGKQLGRIEDFLVVLLRHSIPSDGLLPEEQKAISALKRMLDDVADVRERRGSKTVLRP
ncbi:MAG TPA: hypothetical protein VMU06_18555 [Stellaceae bacterium]|jgi:hypothetical protein|nr:hypothetical protein [Stellaceae bacterium]